METGNIAKGPEHTMFYAYMPPVSSRKARWNDPKHAEEMLSERGKIV